MNITAALLDFLMSLLRDPDAAAEFAADPEGALEKAGLSEITCDDVDTVMPVVLDYAPMVGEREYNTGGNTTTGGDAGGPVTGGSGGHGGHGGHGGNGGNGGHGHGHGHGVEHAHAVQQIHHVVKNYSYTVTDDRDTIVDQSVNQNIWADGDVLQVFDQDSVVASGDHAVAAGDDAWVDQSTDNSIDVDLEAGGDINIGNTTDSYNDDHSKIEDSFNEDNSVDVDLDVKVDDSFNTDNSTDNSEDNDIIVKDNELNYSEDNSVDNSTDNSQDNDIIVKDNELNYSEDNDVIVKDNEVNVIEDSVVVQDNEVDFEYEEENTTVIKDNDLHVGDHYEVEEVVVAP
jgi:hypothetical protein